MLSQNCEAFFKLRCGFSHDAAQKNQLLTDDPESLSALDNAVLLRSLWNMRLDDIPQQEQQKLIEKARILPVNGSKILDDAHAILNKAASTVRKHYPDFMRNLKGETALECRCQLTVPQESGNSHDVTLMSRLPLPANCLTDRVRLVLRFSSCSPEKKLNCYLEHLLLNAVRPEEICGMLLFISEKKGIYTLSTCVLPAFSQEQARSILTTLMGIALKTYTADKPLPIFANASSAKAEGGNDDAVRKEFLEDVKKNKVIERFYSQDDFLSPEFNELTLKIYTPVTLFVKEKKK
jgi:exonuclease V gamma subunit